MTTTTFPPKAARRLRRERRDVDTYEDERDYERPRFVWDKVDRTGSLFDPHGDAEPQLNLSRQLAEAKRREWALPSQIIMTKEESGIIGAIFANKMTLVLTPEQLAANAERLTFMLNRGWIEVDGHKITLAKRLRKLLREEDFLGVEDNEWRYKRLVLVIQDDDDEQGD